MHEELLLLFSALLKMGDYYWYGCQGEKDVTMATNMYAAAVKKNDPQVNIPQCVLPPR